MADRSDASEPGRDRMTSNRIDDSEVPDFRSMLEFGGTSVVVLGGGNGIGRQTSHAAAQAGAKVVCVDKEIVLAESVADETGGVALTADITDREALRKVFGEARSQAGPIRGIVDIVGIADIGPLEDVTDARWEWQFDIVLNHAFRVAQIGAEFLSDNGGGAMVFVGSISGVEYVSGQAAYGTAKAALHHLVSCAGREFAPHGIRVNAVAPGFVRTPRLNELLDQDGWQRASRSIPRGTAAAPSEIAAPILFLLSEMSTNITGHVLVADGGMTRWIDPAAFSLE